EGHWNSPTVGRFEHLPPPCPWLADTNRTGPRGAALRGSYGFSNVLASSLSTTLNSRTSLSVVLVLSRTEMRKGTWTPPDSRYSSNKSVVLVALAGATRAGFPPTERGALPASRLSNRPVRLSKKSFSSGLPSRVTLRPTATFS